MLVVGMHRSGTSALTQALVALGLDPGREPLLPATEDNPTGLFEVDRLRGLDDEILDSVDGRWAAPPDVEPAALAALARTDLGDRARQLRDELFPDSGWVHKDPRLSLLLPFWRAVLTPEPAAVVVIRHPLEVARSLQARDGIALDYGLALWERYTRVMLRDLEGMAAYVVDYDDVMEDPEAVLTRLAGFVADQGRPVDDAAVSVAVAQIGDHRRQLVADEDLATEPAATDQLRDLYRLVLELRGAHDSFPPVTLGPETPHLQTAFTEHKRLSRYEEKVEPLQSLLALRDAEIADLRAEMDVRSRQASDAIDGLIEDRDALTAELDELKQWWPVLTALRIRRVPRRLFDRR